MSEPICYVMVGLPALGKSTLIEGMYNPDTWIYSTDALLEEWAAEEAKTYNEVFNDLIGEATAAMNHALDIAIRERLDIIWDQTNLGVKKRQSIINRMKAKGYQIRGICLMPPVTPQDFAEWKRRLEGRPGKTIPQHILANMMETYIVPTIEEGFDTITFYDMYGGLIGIDYGVEE